jgi:hypothetical protein
VSTLSDSELILKLQAENALFKARFFASNKEIARLECENAALRKDLEFQAALTAALLPYQDQAVALREVLREYLAEYPAFRSRPVGGPQSKARVRQDSLASLEDRARALLEEK